MLKKFGNEVFNYYLLNFSNTDSFKLSMDDYTFSELVLISGLEEEKLVRQIQLKDTRFSDEFEALAIAAYQVKIVGDIESIIDYRLTGLYIGL